MKSMGKQGQKWLRTRAQWIKENPEPYFCYYCKEQLMLNELELDHSRSRRPDLRFEMTNLVPSCHRCNTAKGSRSADEYLKEINL